MKANKIKALGHFSVAINQSQFVIVPFNHPFKNMFIKGGIIHLKSNLGCQICLFCQLYPIKIEINIFLLVIADKI